MFSVSLHLNVSCFLPTDKLEPFNKTLPKDALDLYPVSGTCPTVDRCPEWAYTTMASDIRVTCPNNELAGLAAGKLNFQPVILQTPVSSVCC